MVSNRPLSCYVAHSGVLVHNKCVARKGSYRADVRVGGDPNHATGHAHIYHGSEDLESVDANGSVLAGHLTPGAQRFVNRHLAEIKNGIMNYYYLR